ncbi:MAG TPA: hypothetical protein VFS76_25490 [Pyrinomonadaceae bacterium]|nr:hypothetical protein [Pyrinomonadaceae bacterium]
MFDASLVTRFRAAYRRPAMLCALFLVFICPQTNAGTSDLKLQKALVERAAFGADQIAALERGEPVAKLIPSSDPREVAVCGAVQIPADPEIALKAFQLTLSLKEKSLLQSGKFTNSPRVEDLASLTLSDGDIADLKTCTVGNCKLKLSQSMIERFQKNIDWTATDYKEQANHLFRLMMVEYVTAYLQKGDIALIEYADQSPIVSLAREQESLLTSLLYVNEMAPEFVRQLKAFPRSAEPIEHSLSWAMINFGLKPVFVITNVATYRSNVDGVPRVLVLSKQIYASHYFDASLSLTAVIGDQTRTKSDLLYVNHSRAGALASSFSKFKHRIVEGRATEDLKGLLGQTRINLDVVLNNSSPAVQPTLIQRLSESRVLRIVVLLVLLKMLGSAFYLMFRRKKFGRALRQEA